MDDIDGLSSEDYDKCSSSEDEEYFNRSTQGTTTDAKARIQINQRTPRIEAESSQFPDAINSGSYTDRKHYYKPIMES